MHCFCHAQLAFVTSSENNIAFVTHNLLLSPPQKKTLLLSRTTCFCHLLEKKHCFCHAQLAFVTSSENNIAFVNTQDLVLSRPRKQSLLLYGTAREALDLEAVACAIHNQTPTILDLRNGGILWGVLLREIVALLRAVIEGVTIASSKFYVLITARAAQSEHWWHHKSRDRTP